MLVYSGVTKTIVGRGRWKTFFNISAATTDDNWSCSKNTCNGTCVRTGSTKKMRRSKSDLRNAPDEL